jgi:hypothetical protein
MTIAQVLDAIAWMSVRQDRLGRRNGCLAVPVSTTPLFVAPGGIRSVA